MMRYLLLALTIMLFGTLSCNAQSQSDIEEKIRADINAEFDENMSKCDAGVDFVTDFNRKTEFWRICNLDENRQIIKIESHKENTYYEEVYFEKNGGLVYAKETEYDMPKNYFIQQAWNCEFYINNGELVSLMSLGHGKTESDDWDPNSIFEMYKTRQGELEKIKE